MQLKLIDGTVLRFKLEVIEHKYDQYISTLWRVDDCAEVDREVTEFETYSAALAHMYRTALEVSLEYSTLHSEEN